MIAAGQGSRLLAIAASKPLAPLVGIPMIERVSETALLGGVDELVVETGYEGERLEGSLDAFAARRDLKLTHVRNDDWIGPNACRCRRRNPSWATDSCS